MHVPNKPGWAWTGLRTDKIIQSVELNTIAHATDDLDKVQTALNRVLPEALRGRQLFTRKYLVGHFNNPIVTFAARLTDASGVDEFSSFLLHQLARGDILTIENQLDLHTDEEGNLYLRIDKQRAYLGVLRLSESDPIRVRLKFTRFGGDITELIKRYLESA
jgi:RNA binding exosome subunit